MRWDRGIELPRNQYAIHRSMDLNNLYFEKIPKINSNRMILSKYHVVIWGMVIPRIGVVMGQSCSLQKVWPSHICLYIYITIIIIYTDNPKQHDIGNIMNLSLAFTHSPERGVSATCIDMQWICLGYTGITNDVSMALSQISGDGF